MQNFQSLVQKNLAKYLKPKRINLTDKEKGWHFKHNPNFFKSKYLDLGKTCNLHLMPHITK